MKTKEEITKQLEEVKKILSSIISDNISEHLDDSDAINWYGRVLHSQGFIYEAIKLIQKEK